MTTAKEVIKATQLPRVDNAISALRQCFTYDPPQKWRPHYTTLLFAREEIRRALTPALWINIAILAFCLGYSVHAWLTSREVSLWIAFAPIASIYGSFLIMERINPLVGRLRAIADVCRPFDAFTKDQP